jgi:DNA invertase Pin-like site-specific DNA recombinase
MIMSILNHLMNTGVRVWTIKDNYRLGNNIQSKVLTFAFALSAEIERDLISQRIREALARKKSEGAILGRPKGKKSSQVKLSGNEKQIQRLIDKYISKSAIGRIYDVNRMTVDSFIKNRMPQQE